MENDSVSRNTMGYRILDALYAARDISNLDNEEKVDFLLNVIGAEQEPECLMIKTLRGNMYERTLKGKLASFFLGREHKRYEAIPALEEMAAEKITESVEKLVPEDRSRMMIASFRSHKPESQRTIDALVKKASGVYAPKGTEQRTYGWQGSLQTA